MNDATWNILKVRHQGAVLIPLAISLSCITTLSAYAHENRSPHISYHCGTSNSLSESARGRVFLDANSNGQLDADESGIPDVNVSNGCEVVQTNAQGEYEIQLGPMEILFISQPAGFMAPVDENNIPRFFYLHYPDGSPTDIAGTAVDWEWDVIAPTGPLPETIRG